MIIGSVKVIEVAIDSEPMKVPIAILWPQKGPPKLRARSSSSRELAWQTAQDYTPADEAASHSAISEFGPLYYPAAGLHNSLPQQLITVSLPTKKTRNLYPSAERDNVTKGTDR